MTIASRFSRNTIQIYDSYKFDSKTEKIHHYRSLDTWLSGLSHVRCEYHRWARET